MSLFLNPDDNILKEFSDYIHETSLFGYFGFETFPRKTLLGAEFFDSDRAGSG